MLGAVIGDIVGSRFEWDNIKTKEFEFLHEKCHPTDDSFMTAAVCKALLMSRDGIDSLGQNAIACMRQIADTHPNGGYGLHFREWLHDGDPQPYNSCGNGAAMRVSGCGYAARSLDEAESLSDAVTGITHNHPEGIKAGRAVASAIFLARHGGTMDEIRSHVEKHYYKNDFTIDEIRPGYRYDVTCQGSVPQAFQAFYEARDFEDAVRNAVSIGGDSDTIGAITGSMAEALFGVPESIKQKARSYLDREITGILDAFDAAYDA